MKKERILSIDWDYFIDASAQERLLKFPDGGNENLSSTISNLIWGCRYADSIYWNKKDASVRDIEKIPVKEKEFKFIREVLVNLNPMIPAYVVNSHFHAYEFITTRFDTSVEVYNIDFHHDVYDISLDEINCGNWLAHLILESSVNKVFWIGQEDSEKDENSMSDKAKNCMEFTSNIEIIKDLSFDGVFLCRSPVWSPPHLDSKFMSLARVIKNKHASTVWQRGVDVNRFKKVLVQIEQELRRKAELFTLVEDIFNANAETKK